MRSVFLLISMQMCEKYNRFQNSSTSTILLSFRYFVVGVLQIQIVADLICDVSRWCLIHLVHALSILDRIGIPPAMTNSVFLGLEAKATGLCS